MPTRSGAFTSRATIAHNEDTSVTLDDRSELHYHMRTGAETGFAASCRFDTVWVVYATTNNVMAPESSRQPYTLTGPDFASDQEYIGVTLSWVTV